MKNPVQQPIILLSDFPSHNDSSKGVDILPTWLTPVSPKPRIVLASNRQPRNTCSGTSLVVQWLRLHTQHAGGPGSIPGQETRSHMLQLRVCMLQLRVLMPQLKSPHTATKKKKRSRMLQRRSLMQQKRPRVPQLRPGTANK